MAFGKNEKEKRAFFRFPNERFFSFFKRASDNAHKNTNVFLSAFSDAIKNQ